MNRFSFSVPALFDDDIPLTPREVRMQRVGRMLRVTALVYGAFAALMLLVSTLAGFAQADRVFSVLAGVFLFDYEGTANAAVVALVLMLLANVSLLLVLMISLLAQEFWALIFAVLVIVTNAGALVLFGFTPAVLALGVTVIAIVISVQDWRSFRINPVMLKEVRERMRGNRAFVIITAYLTLMSAFAVLLYLIQRGVVVNTGSAVTGELGRVVFAGVVGIELLLIIFIAPAFTAGAVTNERERKTYDLLQMTLLPRPSFVVGKLESALSYIFLLLFAAIPLQSIAFLFGGVTELEVILAFVILAVTAITLGAVGMYFSTTVNRTLLASLRAYAAAFVITIAVPLLLSFFVNIFNNALLGTGTNITGSPALEAALIYLGALLVSMNPVLTALSTQQLLIDQQQFGFWQATLSSDGSTIPLVSPWISFTIIYLIVSSVLIVLAVRQMRRAEGEA